MNSEYYTLTISQNTSDTGSFSLYLKEHQCNKKQFLMSINFAESSLIDSYFIDDMISLIARSIAKKLVKNALPSEPIPSAHDTKQAKEIVDAAISKIKKTL